MLSGGGKKYLLINLGAKHLNNYGFKPDTMKI